MTVAPSVPDASSRLLAQWLRTGRPADLAEHARRYRRLPAATPAEIVDAVTTAGLRGRGGAWFPTGRKLATVASHAAAAGVGYVVVNASESEPTSGKDRLLLEASPHLVLDGAELAAVAVGARHVTICVHRDAHGLTEARAAIAERRAAGWGVPGVRISAMSSPRWYVAADATALARFVGGGPAKPRGVSAYKRGVRDRPTLVSNAETFAHLAMIVREGAQWFRQVGTEDTPGSWLVTLSGAVVRPGVYEQPIGTPIADMLDRAGGASEPWQAVLLGGYYGSWAQAESTLPLPLAPESLRAQGIAPGAGVVVGLPANACGLTETARVATWMASQSARQCGPCFRGAPVIAEEFAALTWGRDRRALQRLRYAMAMVYRRGACSYPDGIVTLVESALKVFAEDIRVHLAEGGCAWMSRTPTLPVPPPFPRGEPWR